MFASKPFLDLAFLLPPPVFRIYVLMAFLLLAPARYLMRYLRADQRSTHVGTYNPDSHTSYPAA